MSTQKGNVKKKGQKHQNIFEFKHNKNSSKTKKIMQAPLDFLCEKCLKIMEWKIKYRKYKPLTTPSLCVLCEKYNILKAHRNACDLCSKEYMVCSKCVHPCESFAQPTNRRNFGNYHSTAKGLNKKELEIIEEIIKNLKERQKRTVLRRIENKERIVFDDKLGLINKDTQEVLFSLDELNFLTVEEDDEEKEEEEEADEDELEKEMNKDNKKEEKKAEEAELIEKDDGEVDLESIMKIKELIKEKESKNKEKVKEIVENK